MSRCGIDSFEHVSSELRYLDHRHCFAPFAAVMYLESDSFDILQNP